jgi:hypothetical protein
VYIARSTDVSEELAFITLKMGRWYICKKTARHDFLEDVNTNTTVLILGVTRCFLLHAYLLRCMENESGGGGLWDQIRKTVMLQCRGYCQQSMSVTGVRYMYCEVSSFSVHKMTRWPFYPVPEHISGIA